MRAVGFSFCRNSSALARASFRFWNSERRISKGFERPGTARLAPIPCVLQVNDLEQGAFLSFITQHCSSGFTSHPADRADKVISESVSWANEVQIKSAWVERRTLESAALSLVRKGCTV